MLLDCTRLRVPSTLGPHYCGKLYRIDDEPVRRGIWKQYSTCNCPFWPNGSFSIMFWKFKILCRYEKTLMTSCFEQNRKQHQIFAELNHYMYFHYTYNGILVSIARIDDIDCHLDFHVECYQPFDNQSRSVDKRKGNSGFHISGTSMHM